MANKIEFSEPEWDCNRQGGSGSDLFIYSPLWRGSRADDTHTLTRNKQWEIETVGVGKDSLDLVQFNCSVNLFWDGSLGSPRQAFLSKVVALVFLFLF